MGDFMGKNAGKTFARQCFTGVPKDELKNKIITTKKDDEQQKHDTHRTWRFNCA